MGDPNISRIGVLGRVADFPPSGLREVEVEGRKILLVKRGDAVSAIGGVCPHAGASLAEGVLDGERVICPWHKAAFSIGRGKCVEPPAVDDVAAYDIEIVDGDIVLRGECTAAQAKVPEADPRCFVIIGAGAAGFSAAQELRREGFSGRLVLVDRTGALPYDRTVLSKSVLAGRTPGEKTPLQEEAFFDINRIERMTGNVVALDPMSRRVLFEDGGTLGYDAALVATGGKPKHVKLPGGDLKNVFVLRSNADAERIVAAAEAGKRCVVAGAGFIGMEVAAALRQRGLEVTVAAPEAAPFEKTLGAHVGNVYRRIHEGEGVRFRLGEAIEGFEGDDTVRLVRLGSGETLAVDFVVAGLGIAPETAFVKDAKREEDGGLVVDARLRVADGLYAAGDVALFPLRGDETQTIRVEHWRVAEQQGRVAARNMLGRDELFDAVPVFWTIQYMQRLDYVGHAGAADDVVIRGNLEERQFIAYYVRDGLVAAAAGMKRDQDMASIIALMTRRTAWKVDELHPEGGSPAEVLRRQ